MGIYKDQMLTLAMNKPIDRTRYQVVQNITVGLQQKAKGYRKQELPIGTMSHFFFEGKHYMARDEVHQHPPSDPVKPGLKEPHHGITLYFDLKPNIPPTLSNDAKKAFSLATTPNNAGKNWREVYKLINGLSMTEMLGVFDSMLRSDLQPLARNLDYFGSDCNPKRIRFALDVILRRAVPDQVPPDVKQFGQDTEAQTYLKFHLGTPSPIEF